MVAWLGVRDPRLGIRESGPANTEQQAANCGREPTKPRTPSPRARETVPIPLDDPRPLRPVSHRLPARRRRPHRALQLALRAPARRHVRAAHRGHRRRAVVGGDGHRHPRRPALARPRLGRRARTSADRTRRTSSPSGSSATARWRDRLVAEGRAYHCYCSPERLQAKRAGGRSRWRRRGCTTAPA